MHNQPPPPGSPRASLPPPAALGPRSPRLCALGRGRFTASGRRLPLPLVHAPRAHRHAAEPPRPPLVLPPRFLRLFLSPSSSPKPLRRAPRAPRGRQQQQLQQQLERARTLAARGGRDRGLQRWLASARGWTGGTLNPDSQCVRWSTSSPDAGRAPLSSVLLRPPTPRRVSWWGGPEEVGRARMAGHFSQRRPE